MEAPTAVIASPIPLPHGGATPGMRGQRGLGQPNGRGTPPGNVPQGGGMVEGEEGCSTRRWTLSHPSLPCPSLLLITTSFPSKSPRSYHGVTEYPELEGTHKDH